MAHTILGFQYHILQEFKAQQKQYDEEEIKLGRETLLVYNRYAKEFAPLRCIRLTADCLGPVVDEKIWVWGKWLAYCRQNKIKSTIEHYQDSQFNATFQVAAEIHHHGAEISDFGQKLENSNRKVRSVLLDRTDPRVRSVIHALAVVYVKVTGPCWDTINNKSTGYLDLPAHIRILDERVELWLSTPLLTWQSNDEPILPGFVTDASGAMVVSAMVAPDDREFFRTTLRSILSGVWVTIKQRMKDLLPEGRYGSVAREEQEPTRFAGATNITCERHFGSLDSIRNRRRNASFFYHLSLIMLKAQKKQTSWKTFLQKKLSGNKHRVWEKARKGGRTLRKKNTPAG